MGRSQEDIDAALALCEQYPNVWKNCERDWFELEYPQHSVSIDSYWIDSTEVTNLNMSAV
jgi:formylglycine-generating enzyme required for sulfatase activity